VPLYEYECAKCHRRTEKIESVSGPHLKKCPHCGGKVERLLAPPAIQFKGAGWYVTDYASKKGRPSENTASEKSQTTEKSESAKEAPAKETTPKDHKEKSTGKK
jgi:putative FmdB family regulatory protein